MRSFASTPATTPSSGTHSFGKVLRYNPDVVGAVVMYDEPTEQVTDYAPYRLTVNGVLQPGG